MKELLALLIFLLTYAIIAIQKIPRVHISRAAGALIGAVAMPLVGVLTPQEAYSAIDLDTLIFLLGMMILVAHLEIAGFFELLELWILKRARTRRELLFLVVASSGLLSAVFMNDTICLMFTPVLVRLTQRLQLNPVPYLLGLVMAANAGSVATPIGNPQNMLIALRSHVSFLDFVSALAPIALLSLSVIFVGILLVFRRDLQGGLNALVDLPEYHELPVQRGLLTVGLLTLGLFLVLLFWGTPPQWAAIICAALLLVLASNRPRRALQHVDWTLLLLFSGLFVVMRGVESVSLLDRLVESLGPWLKGSRLEALGFLAGVALVVSNLVSNVPAVLLLAPIVVRAGMGTESWLALAMSATLAGNLTIIGSAANLIVLEIAAQRGVHLGFWTYLKVGLPVTIATLMIGTAWLMLIS
ncbi:MAG: anion transporter [Candidatus Bipolaricaulota bacterium]|nr:anion transporter [Candidatus Bipolaricaulota bacterium]MCS7273987.1 anion transporter [Candidatus Bipolaricaulota bacterium]MDW8111340.1 anion transporter [Candidatus Bipolaricaulota bacterium]MDW8329240.1 anion transporter [Candidatus Bipolaricaulota bacterium]